MATGTQALADLQALMTELATDGAEAVKVLKDLLASISAAAAGGPGAAQIEELVQKGKTALTALEAGLTAAQAAAPAISVSITPTSATLAPGASEQFEATVLNAGDTTVTWRAQNGSISAGGLYTAPTTVGSDQVAAVSNEDPSKNAVASVTIQ